ncbi:MAG TPA: tRNA adenosine(34) deaminase TadA [Methylomirabilota bacterium]|nr:tRNA adenosine(34) deaminase TadA [Methylomirabilota bacterium]
MSVPPQSEDQRWMMEALREAAQAEAEGEAPVGAVIVTNGRIIGRGHNAPITLTDPTAHAEIQALRAAAHSSGNYRLVDATVYVTVEPCVMCMGALLHARVRRVVFGCYDAKFGAAGSLYDLSCDARFNHQIIVTAGVAEEECRELLQRFFQKKRLAGKKAKLEKRKVETSER